MSVTYRFHLPYVVCGSCTDAVERAINQYIKSPQNQDAGDTNQSIQQCRASFLHHRLTVVVDDECIRADVLRLLQTVLDDIGQEVTDDVGFSSDNDLVQHAEQGDDDQQTTHDIPPLPTPPLSFWGWFQKKLRSHWVLGSIGVVAGIALLLMSLLTGTLPLMAMIGITAVSIVLTLGLGDEFFNKARIQLIHDREPAMDTLFAISTITVIIVSIASFFVPGLPMMLEAGLLIFGFRHIGLAIRDSLSQTIGLRKGFQEQAPKFVQRLGEDGHFECVSLEDINAGDVLLIEPDPDGQRMIPIDGWCDEPDERSILVSKIYGEILPRQFKSGDRIFAGMILAPGEPPMRMRVGVPGYNLKLLYQVPSAEDLDEHELGLYLEKDILYFAALDGSGEIRSFQITDQQLLDKQQIDHALAIRDVLLDSARAKKLERVHEEHIFSITSNRGYSGAPAIKSYLARLDRAIEIAESTKGPIEAKTEEILKYFIPTVLFLAVASGVIIGLFFPPALAIQCAVAVLVSACPCTLGLITPVAVQIGMQKAAANGVVFSQAKALEDADEIDCVVFDLHGTLTKGTPSVDLKRSSIIPGTGFQDLQALLTHFAVLEQDCLTHPIAKAIYDAAGGDVTVSECQLQVENSDKQTNHSGLTGEINGAKFILGNRDMMKAHGVKLPRELQKSGDTIVYLAREESSQKKVLVGYLVIRDPLREDARRTVQLLQESGKEVHICTGTTLRTAKRYAKKLNIDPEHVCANRVGVADESTTEDKKAYIDRLQQSGRKVAVIGDGVNDLIAMESGQFSIAVKHQGGDEATQQHAGAVIESGSLLPVVTAFEVSKQAVANIKQNLLFSLGYNIAAVLIAGGLLLTIGIVLNPGVGVALMILQTCLLFLNAYRFQQQALVHLKPAQVHNPVDEPVTEDDECSNSYVNIMRKTPGSHPNARRRNNVEEERQAVYHRLPLSRRANVPSQVIEQQDELLMALT